MRKLLPVALAAMTSYAVYTFASSWYLMVFRVI